MKQEQAANVLTVSVERAAALLGIGRATAYQCVRAGRIPSLRFGRRVVVPVRALERLLDGAEASERP